MKAEGATCLALEHGIGKDFIPLLCTEDKLEDFSVAKPQ